MRLIAIRYFFLETQPTNATGNINWQTATTETLGIESAKSRSFEYSKEIKPQFANKEKQALLKWEGKIT